jgi:hypothetical protein
LKTKENVGDDELSLSAGELILCDQQRKGKKMTLVALRKYNKNQDIIDALNKVH